MGVHASPPPWSPASSQNVRHTRVRAIWCVCQDLFKKRTKHRKGRRPNQYRALHRASLLCSHVGRLQNSKTITVPSLFLVSMLLLVACPPPIPLQSSRNVRHVRVRVILCVPRFMKNARNTAKAADQTNTGQCVARASCVQRSVEYKAPKRSCMKLVRSIAKDLRAEKRPAQRQGPSCPV